jgi:integrase/recombinase XerD
MLVIYRRHKKACGHREKGRAYRGCHCPIWVDGILAGKEIRQSLKLRDWQKAQGKIREWEAENQIAETKDPETLAGAWESFISDCKARGLRESTIRKHAYLQRQMEGFAKRYGLRDVKEFDVEILTKFRAEWKLQNFAALKQLERLRTFFRFCEDRGWIDDNPARKIRNPKMKERPTLPFAQEEVIRILAACETIKRSATVKLRLRAFVILLRYSGLRIGDAVTLARNRILSGRLFLYTSKAGTPVHCPLPDVLLRALDSIPAGSPYYFWTGRSKPQTAVAHWQGELAELFQTAKVEKGHAHRFRDTFAVSLLLQRVPMERVSVLLGHRSIRVTEKHYSPWVKARQEQLEADVRRTWVADQDACEGTPEVHGNSDRVM